MYTFIKNLPVEGVIWLLLKCDLASLNRYEYLFLLGGTPRDSMANQQEMHHIKVHVMIKNGDACYYIQKLKSNPPQSMLIFP